MKFIITNAELAQQTQADETTSHSTKPTSGQVAGYLQQAIAHHHAGQLQDAERLYRAILQAQLSHPDANHNLGVLAVQFKQPVASLPYFAVALQTNPNQGQYWLSYIDALIQSGRVDVARQMLAQGRQHGLQGEVVEALAVRLEEAAQVAAQSTVDQLIFQESPSVPAAAPQNNKKKLKTKSIQPNKSAKKPTLHRRKTPSPQEIDTLSTLFTAGRYTEVATLAQTMTERFPLHSFGWKALGAIYQQVGRNADALAPLQKVVALLPGDAMAHSNLGVILHELGRLDEAEASYRRALQIKSDYAEAHSNLGNTLQKLGQLEGAEASCRRALQIKPDNAMAHNNLGIILKELARLDEAEASFRRALQIEPHYAEAHNNLGGIHQELGQLNEADASYQRALQIRPDYAEAHSNLGNTLKELNRLVEAEASYRRALQIKPNYASAHQHLASLLAHLSDFEQVLIESDAALHLNPDDAFIWEQRLYTYSYHPDLTAQEIYGEFVRWGDRFPDPVVDFSAHDHTPGRRLRIGYVSPDFRRHTSRFFFWPLFANHDPTVVELYAYSNVMLEDDVTQQFKGVFDHWRNIRGVKDDEVARIIRQDGIDILVDCCNHMRDDRLGVFTLKPAPIQATWLGAAWTTGLKMIDYALIDPYMAPEGTLTRETIVRLPHCFVAYRPPEETAEIAPPPCLKNGYVTFGYSGRTERLNHHTFRVWGEILRQNPTARLILDFRGFDDPPTQAYYRQFMARHGMDPSQVIMRKSANIFAGLNDIDILLDCFPHSGGTMLFDALWMGVPVLTLASRPPVGRIGTSLMMNLGLPEWVAESEQEYIGKAGTFAANPHDLVKLRAGMRDRMQSSPLMDGVGFARGVETAYREMFEKWVQDDRQGQQGETVNVLTDRIEGSSENEPSSQEMGTLVALFDAGHHTEAATLAQTLTERFPLHGFGWKALGAVLIRMGRNADALAPIQKAAALSPDDAGAHNDLGNIFLGQGHLTKAEICYQQALAINPDYAQAHYNLGITLKDLGRFTEAEASYRQALAINPDFAEAYNNLGSILHDLGRLDEAEVYFRRALQIESHYAEAHGNLGNTLRDLGRLDEAEASLQWALQIKPDYAEAHNNLGNTRYDCGRLEEAETSYQRALQIKPDYTEAYYNLGITLQALGRPIEAESSFRQALQTKPSYAEALNSLGNTLKDLDRLDEAEASFRQALQLKPDYVEAFSNLLFTLNYHPDKSGEEIFEIYREYDARFGLPHQSEWQAHDNSRETQRRLKVGYISPDFKNHSVRNFLQPLLVHHDKQIVEVYAYAELTREDSMTALYKNYVDHWIPTRGLSDSAVAERVHADGIDILVDLAGHTAYNRLGVFARKPAPVSVSWLGYGYTTGLSAIDYYLTDEVCVPPGCENLFSEKPWRIEAPSLVYRPAEGMGEVSALPALERGYVTFGTLTRAVRINYRTLQVWARLLKRVPNSRLVIDSHDFKWPPMQDRLVEKFAALGVGRERLEIGYHSPPWDSLRRIDIGLDCFPHNSGTTLFESLYMGLPLVTLAGRPSVGRLGNMILEGVKHPEWIAQSEEEYIEIVVGLVSSLGRLAQLRAGLRDEMCASPFMNESAFARKIEKAFLEMWAINCRKEKEV